jgi:hypothetical protein|tara:strand:+ start:2848 stop:2994 length:147 start_codon:yes stop_codon:yes gene_type:complete
MAKKYYSMISNHPFAVIAKILLFRLDYRLFDFPKKDALKILQQPLARQ